VQIHSSTNAGMYLCEYIFRASLLEAEKRGKMGRVLFLHVPPRGKPYSVETGVEVVKTVVEGMVVSGELAEEGVGMCGPDGC
jgi:pyrrolidone-carboxylate peptidase